jgi:hypothetical protein
MLVNGTVRSNVIFLHGFDEVGFAEVRWRFGFLLSDLDQGIKLLRDVGFEGGVGPLNERVDFKKVFFPDGQVSSLELFTSNLNQRLKLIPNSIFGTARQEVPADHIVNPPLLMSQRILVHILDRMDRRVRLVVRATHFRRLKFILVQQLANVLVVLVVRP